MPHLVVLGGIELLEELDVEEVGAGPPCGARLNTGQAISLEANATWAHTKRKKSDTPDSDLNSNLNEGRHPPEYGR